MSESQPPASAVPVVYPPEFFHVLAFIEWPLGVTQNCPCNSGLKYKKCCYLRLPDFAAAIAEYDQCFGRSPARTYYLYNPFRARRLHETSLR